MDNPISANELKNRIRARIDSSAEDRNNTLFSMALTQIEAFETKIINLENEIKDISNDRRIAIKARNN